MSRRLSSNHRIFKHFEQLPGSICCFVVQGDYPDMLFLEMNNDAQVLSDVPARFAEMGSNGFVKAIARIIRRQRRLTVPRVMTQSTNRYTFSIILFQKSFNLPSITQDQIT